MVPPIPFDVAIAIIDQAEDDPRSLRNLALTSHDFLLRSRRHLLTWHVFLQSPKMMYDFCDHLDASPHLQPIVRCVTLALGSNAYYVPEDETPSMRALFYITPMRLLKLPNLRHWKLECYLDKEFFLYFHRSQLDCLRVYSASIATLDIHGVNFTDPSQVAHFLFAFPGLRSLKISEVYCKRDGTEVAFMAARGRLAKQLHLTSLDIGDGVKRSLQTLLLEIGQPTIETLAISLPQRENPDGERIHALVRGMSALRSVTVSPPFDNVTLFVVDAWELIKGLPSSPPRNHTIVVPSLCDLHLALGTAPLVDICGQLEQFFIHQPSHSIVFQGRGTKLSGETFWTTTLATHFPELHRQGRFAIKGDKSSDAYYMAGHNVIVRCLAISPDSKWVASGSGDGTIIVSDVQRGNIILQWVAHGNRSVRDLAFSPDSCFLMSGGGDDLVIIWDVEGGGAQIATLEAHHGGVQVCAWSPNGTLLASGHEDGTVRVWDAKSFAQLHCFKNAGGVLNRFVRFSPDGRWLAFLGEEEKCYDIWDTVNCRSHKTLHTGGNPRVSAAFDPSNKRIALSAKDYTVHVWDVETAEELVVLRGHEDWISDVAFSTKDYTVHVWDVETAEELVVLRGHEDWISDVAFSPSGDWVLSASEDGTAKIWDSHTGDIILSLEGHTGYPYSACFSPDGKYVASASTDRTVRLWRTSDGSCVRRFTEHTDGVRHVLFSPDGETLCSGADDGTVVVRRFRDVLL